MSKLPSVWFAGLVGSAMSVLGVVPANAAVVPPNLAVAEMQLPWESTFQLVAPMLLVTFGFIVWMLLLLCTKPKQKSQPAVTTKTIVPTHAVWFDGALDSTRFRRRA